MPKKRFSEEQMAFALRQALGLAAPTYQINTQPGNDETTWFGFAEAIFEGAEASA